MKALTYTTTVTRPRLVIEYDDQPESPREWDNLGYFITCERDCISPDGEKYPHIQQIIIETAEEAISREYHVELIKAALLLIGEDVVEVYPVHKYEHSGVVYRLGAASGWDISNCGFYIVTKKSQEAIGTPDELIEKVINDELDLYTQWANGAVYRFTLYDEAGGVEDSCGGFYDIKDIAEHLPDEFKGVDLDKYLIY